MKLRLLYSKKHYQPAMNKDYLAQNAISAALCGDWEKAVLINKNIVDKDPKDTDALNRLSRAHAELGEFSTAKKIAQTVLKIDPFNSIAIKALEKWKGLKKKDAYSAKPSNAHVFLEEPGKTKIISLLHLGDTKALVKLDSGDEVKLNHHSHKVSVVTQDGKYIGRLSDELSARLRKLISLGNDYQAFIKSADTKEVKVFIRETKRDKKLLDVPSFPTERIEYVSFTPPELVHKKEAVAEEVEEE